jgi:hypothetical protein
MALELKLVPTQVNEAGNIITISDATDYTGYSREDFALFLTAKKESLSESIDIIIPEQVTPNTTSSWEVKSSTDANYTIKLYVFNIANENPIVDDVVFDVTSSTFSKWTGSLWLSINFEQALEYAKLVETLMIPVLFKARTHKTNLILKYVENAISIDPTHRDKNRSFYERSELDHFNALLISAEYSYGLNLLTSFYDTLNLLEELIKSNTD